MRCTMTVDRGCMSCGFLAGVLGGAYGMKGLGDLWGDEAVVSTAFSSDVAGIFPGDVAMAGYWIAGLWAVTH